MSDQTKGHKVPKRQTADKVEAVRPDEPDELEAAPSPPAEEPELTDEERAAAASEAPKPEAPKVEPRKPTRFRVTSGGRAWFDGQQIKFTTGEEFTTETWDERLIDRFRECGVGIEKL